MLVEFGLLIGLKEKVVQVLEALIQIVALGLPLRWLHTDHQLGDVNFDLLLNHFLDCRVYRCFTSLPSSSSIRRTQEVLVILHVLLSQPIQPILILFIV